MAHTCSQCGRPYADSDLTQSEISLDGLSSHSDSGGPTSGPGPNSRLVGWLGAGIALWLLLSLGIGLFRSPEPAPVAMDATPTPQPTAIATPTPDLTEVEAPLAATAPQSASVPSAQAHDAPTLPPEPDDALTERAPRGGPASGLRMLQRQLERQSVAASIAYATADGIAIISMDTLEVHQVTAMTGPVDVDPGALVLQTERGPLVVDPAGPAVTHVPIEGDLVVNEETGESYVLVGGPTDGAVTLNNEAAETIEPRAGSRLLAIEGFGIVAIADEQDGPTVIAGQDSFEPMSDYPIITANQAGQVEARCVTALKCTTVIVEAGGGVEWSVAEDFVRLGDQLHLSPDATAVLRVAPDGYAEIFAAGGWTSWVSGDGMRDPVWAPDSSFIAWIDIETEPALKVMFPETRDWIRVPLADIAAPEPLTPQLVIF